MCCTQKNGKLELWQAGDRVLDITGYVITGAYHIRRIGAFIPDEPDIAVKKDIQEKINKCHL